MKNKNFDNNLFFTCSIIEYVSRITKNKRSYVVNMLGEKGIGFIYEFADVLHSENIDAVADELINDYKIKNGNFDNVKECEDKEYRIPSFWDIGKVYMRLIIKLGGMSATRVIDVYNSYIAECINDYTIGFYFSNPQCIYESYKSGTMLD
ncbi:hypothetical protein [Clostridium sp. ZBS15]|uniref:hypothetical protein n=1 Tax=Clostridium sp. ZBS15 TaxID=2949969 RepID=UPI00207A14E5|nr:hypothetical protein [Clostridium sp. ZBS15]